MDTKILAIGLCVFVAACAESTATTNSECIHESGEQAQINISSCTSDLGCYDLPVACDVDMRCVDGVCICSVLPGTEPAAVGDGCDPILDCPAPAAMCKVAVCVEGQCGIGNAEDGTECLGGNGTCDTGQCYINSPQP